MIEDRTELEAEYFAHIKTERITELPDGYFIDKGRLYFNKLDDIFKPKWDSENKKWVETATEEEITTYIGNLVTDLLYEVLKLGCEVEIKGEKHQQSLSDEKRKALNERISGFKLAEELGSPITHVAWPFKNDGTDTVVMTTDEFKQLALTCLDFGDKCYIAAELLKAKRNINTTLEDFYSELEYIDEINLENL